MEARKNGTPCFLHQSVLLSTIILNDIGIGISNILIIGILHL